MTELLLWSFYPFTRYNGISDDLPSPAYGIKSLAVYIQINSAGIADCYNNLLIAFPGLRTALLSAMSCSFRVLTACGSVFKVSLIFLLISSSLMPIHLAKERINP